ncbi:Hypothetical predicted protein, partial [Marmota monax]
VTGSAGVFTPLHSASGSTRSSSSPALQVNDQLTFPHNVHTAAPFVAHLATEGTPASLQCGMVACTRSL